MYKKKPKYTGLSDRARLMLLFIIEYKKAHDGNSPSMRQAGRAAGVESSSLISYYLAELERAGYIKRNRCAARQIELIGGKYVPPALTVYLMGALNDNQ